MKKNIVTIDGPSGVGKSTISRRIASSLSFTYLDTGAMYRAVALKLKESGVDWDNEQAVEECLGSLSLKLLPAKSSNDDVGVLLDGRDVSREIRFPEMAMAASKVSALAVVRKKLTLMQQEIGGEGRIVAEGRDTGTVVFPNASWKFYLDALPEIRVQRRAKQLRLQGKKVCEKELLEMILKRDRDDKNRSIAPLTRAADAHCIDTGSLSINDVAERMLEIIREHPLPRL